MCMLRAASLGARCGERITQVALTTGQGEACCGDGERYLPRGERLRGRGEGRRAAWGERLRWRGGTATALEALHVRMDALCLTRMGDFGGPAAAAPSSESERYAAGPASSSESEIVMTVEAGAATACEIWRSCSWKGSATACEISTSCTWKGAALQSCSRVARW